MEKKKQSRAPIGCGNPYCRFCQAVLAGSALGVALPTNVGDDFWSLEVFQHCQCAKSSSVSMEYQLLCFACEIELRSGEISNTVNSRLLGNPKKNRMGRTDFDSKKWSARVTEHRFWPCIREARCDLPACSDRKGGLRRPQPQEDKMRR